MHKEDASLKCTKRLRTKNYIYSNILDFCLQHYQLLLPVICFKNEHYRWRPPRDNLQNAAQNSNVSQKTTNSLVQLSMFMLLYALFLSFPVRHTDNFRFDGRHCIGDLMAHAMIRKLLYSQFDRWDPHVNQIFRRKQPISQIKRTTRTCFC